MTEPIEEPAINNIGEFKEFKFVDVTREGLELGDLPEEDKKKASPSFMSSAVNDEINGATRPFPKGCED